MTCCCVTEASPISNTPARFCGELGPVWRTTTRGKPDCDLDAVNGNDKALPPPYLNSLNPELQ